METRRIGAIVALAAGVALSCGLATVGTGSVEPATDASSRDTWSADAAMPPDSTTADAADTADVRDAFPADAADVTDAIPADAADVTDAIPADAADVADAIPADVADAAMPDTNLTDTATEDAGRLDAAPDALDSATFCTTVMPPPTFCADFDEPDASPGDGWNYTMADAGSSLTLSTTTFMSPPRSLHATSTGGVASVSLSFSVVNHLSVDFDVEFPVIAAPVEVSPILLTGPVFPGQDIYYFVQSIDSYFQEFSYESPALAVPSIDVWHHVSITVTTGTTSAINASIDGVSGWTNHPLTNPWPASTTATLRVGIASAYDVQTADDIFIDNVVVRVDQ